MSVGLSPRGPPASSGGASAMRVGSRGAPGLTFRPEAQALPEEFHFY